MPDPVLPDRVLEGAGDRLLADQVREGLGAVAERQHLVVLGARGVWRRYLLGRGAGGRRTFRLAYR